MDDEESLDLSFDCDSSDKEESESKEGDMLIDNFKTVSGAHDRGVGPSDDMFSEKSFSSYDSMDLSEGWSFPRTSTKLSHSQLR